MKFVLLSILALFATTVAVEGRQLDVAEDLRIRWHMDEPNVTYFSDNNTFVLDFSTSSIDNNATDGGMDVNFYDYNCQDDGSGFDEFVVPSGIFGPDGVSNAAMTNGPDGKPQLVFTISPQILSNFPQIYGIVDESMVGTNTRYDQGSGSGSRRQLAGDADSCKSAVSSMAANDPTNAPTKTPTKAPTKAPTKNPTKAPTKAPTSSPTAGAVGGSSGGSSDGSSDGDEASSDGDEASSDGDEASSDGGEASSDGGEASSDGGEASSDGGEASSDGGEASSDGGEASSDDVPQFECTISWLQNEGRWSQWNGVQAQILGGCGPGVPAGYYPDLTNKIAYCHCTGSSAPGSYQTQNNGLQWDIWSGGANQFISGTRLDGKPYGQGGLYGTNGGTFTYDYAVSAIGQNRPPWTDSRRLMEDETINEDTPSWAVNDGTNEEENRRSLYIYQPDDVGKGVMRVCVRSSLGYTKNSFFQEVNFIESLVTVFYDLSAGFCIQSFNVDPKERQETTAAANTYELEAWLCDLDEPFQVRTAPDRSLPAAVASTFLAQSSTPATATYFNQGALVTVCIAPDDVAYADGIRMDGINTFDWSRTDYGITQPAIENRGPAGNYLTSYVPSTCEGAKDYCTFSSILFADFYINTGIASGAGSASLVFASRRNRRLGEEASDEEFGRALQEGDETSTFDLSLGVVGTDDGPAALKVAAGPSTFKTAAFVSSLMALFGAASLLL